MENATTEIILEDVSQLALTPLYMDQRTAIKSSEMDRRERESEREKG